MTGVVARVRPDGTPYFRVWVPGGSAGKKRWLPGSYPSRAVAEIARAGEMAGARSALLCRACGGSGRSIPGETPALLGVLDLVRRANDHVLGRRQSDARVLLARAALVLDAVLSGSPVPIFSDFHGKQDRVVP